MAPPRHDNLEQGYRREKRSRQQVRAVRKNSRANQVQGEHNARADHHTSEGKAGKNDPQGREAQDSAQPSNEEAGCKLRLGHNSGSPKRGEASGGFSGADSVAADSALHKKGDVVMDPMCGSGQTTKVAKSLGRSFVGVDLRREYASLAKKRLKEAPMLSNFIIPLYFPIKWFNSTQSGRKQDAHLDVEEQIPRGYKMVLQKTSRDEEDGTDTTHIYYRNKSGDYLFCVIGSGQEPYMMKVGNPGKKASVAGAIARKLPKDVRPGRLGQCNAKRSCRRALLRAVNCGRA